VERWFAELTNKRIRRGVFRSVKELESAIREYIGVHNEDPTPFVWTGVPIKSSTALLGTHSARSRSNLPDLCHEPLGPETRLRVELFQTGQMVFVDWPIFHAPVPGSGPGGLHKFDFTPLSVNFR
jgi:hypothetical protein